MVREVVEALGQASPIAKLDQADEDLNKNPGTITVLDYPIGNEVVNANIVFSPDTGSVTSASLQRGEARFDYFRDPSATEVFRSNRGEVRVDRSRPEQFRFLPSPDGAAPTAEVLQDPLLDKVPASAQRELGRALAENRPAVLQGALAGGTAGALLHVIAKHTHHAVLQVNLNPNTSSVQQVRDAVALASHAGVWVLFEGLDTASSGVREAIREAFHSWPGGEELDCRLFATCRHRVDGFADSTIRITDDCARDKLKKSMASIMTDMAHDAGRLKANEHKYIPVESWSDRMKEYAQNLRQVGASLIRLGFHEAHPREFESVQDVVDDLQWRAGRLQLMSMHDIHFGSNWEAGMMRNVDAVRQALNLLDECPTWADGAV
ncbi:MAG: hypothetical protein AB1758_27735 [Candidatus Eremiobacterota bacterium]